MWRLMQPARLRIKRKFRKEVVFVVQLALKHRLLFAQRAMRVMRKLRRNFWTENCHDARMTIS